MLYGAIANRVFQNIQGLDATYTTGTFADTLSGSTGLIAQVCRLIQDEHDLSCMQATLDVPLIDGQAAYAEAAYTPRLKKVLKASLLDSAGLVLYPLERMTNDDFASRIMLSAGMPHFYHRYGGTITLYPTPAAGYTMRLACIQRLADLPDVGFDVYEDALSIDLPLAIINRTSALAAVLSRDVAAAKVYMDLYQTAIDAAIKATMQQRDAGITESYPRRGW